MATASDVPALVDANVLVYAVFQESEHHQASRALLDQAQSGRIALCVTSQVLAEFYAVATDARRVSVARQPAEVLQAIRDFLAMPGMLLLPLVNDSVTRWLDLADRYAVTRGRIFDLQLVGAMLANGVLKIYTFDRNDFEHFGEIEVAVP